MEGRKLTRENSKRATTKFVRFIFKKKNISYNWGTRDFVKRVQVNKREIERERSTNGGREGRRSKNSEGCEPASNWVKGFQNGVGKGFAEIHRGKSPESREKKREEGKNETLKQKKGLEKK